MYTVAFVSLHTLNLTYLISVGLRRNLPTQLVFVVIWVPDTPAP